MQNAKVQSPSVLHLSFCILRFALCIFLCFAWNFPIRSLHAVEVITPAQAAEGWIALFDGVSLFGWQLTQKTNLDVKDGEIRIVPEVPGWLMTTSEFADYELHVEFKAPPSTNSGVFLRTSLDPKDPTKDCYEVNIAPVDNPYPTGSIVGRLKTPIKAGGYIPETNPQGYRRIDAAQMPNPWNGEWHMLDVTLNGEHCTAAIDGVVLAKYLSEEDNYGLLAGDMVSSGRIGLQFREGAVAFRNIRLKPLNLKPIFNGTDLSEWKTDLADQSEFTVTPQREIAVKNGPGQLESRESYGDFIMQLDCKVNGEGLNSGIFFRCIPDGKLMGYESQIHNGMKDGDPTKPVDAGTGAIYRRTVARRIVAKDHEWFTKTIIADGPHMAVWVNGIQVTDWTDERPADENPRKGLRTEAGTIAIQGHDPTTDLLFKNLKIAELPD
jgi:hypothetical protein